MKPDFRLSFLQKKKLWNLIPISRSKKTEVFAQLLKKVYISNSSNSTFSRHYLLGLFKRDEYFIDFLIYWMAFQPYVFRNYEHPPTLDSHYRGTTTAPLWKALQATAAAPLYFEEVVHGDFLLQDGGVRFFSELRTIISGVPWGFSTVIRKKVDDNKRGRTSTIRTWVYALLSTYLFIKIFNTKIYQIVSRVFVENDSTFHSRLSMIKKVEQLILHFLRYYSE